MNKKELIDAIAGKTGTAKKDVEATINAFSEVVTETLKSGELVQMVGFGTFEAKERPERQGRNPQTNEAMVIPAAIIPKFKAGKALKDAVNSK